MKKYLVVKADTNDGDYITEKTLVTDAQLESVTPVINAIKKFKPYEGVWKCGNFESKMTHRHNFPIGEQCRDDMGEKTTDELYGHIKGYNQFLKMDPYSEYGIHTIKEATILVVEEETKLL